MNRSRTPGPLWLVLLVAAAGCVTTAGESGPDDPGPPVGLSVIVTGTGLHPALALDEADYPIVAYVREAGAASTLQYRSWDPEAKGWRQEVQVDLVESLDGNAPHRQVALAIDPATGLRGLAYARGAYQIWLALSSDAGATWSTERVDLPDDDGMGGPDLDFVVGDPVLAISGDELHLAYRHECIKTGTSCRSDLDSHAIVYRTRTGAGPWVDELSPTPPGTQDVAAPPSLALDSAGKPGIAYVLRDVDDGVATPTYNRTLVFWRPGSISAHVVTDSADQQNDTPSVSLAFDGTRPRIAFHLRRTAGGTEEDLWLAASDDGAAWPEPGAIPPDGEHATSWWQSLLIDEDGGAILAANHHAGASDGGAASAGGPKLFRSGDLAEWTVESPDPGTLPGAAGRYLQLARTGAGALYLTFHYDVSGNPSLGEGLVLWRER